MRLIRLPIKRRVSGVGQLYSGIASSLHFPGSFEYGLADADISAAAAEIAAESLGHFVLILRMRMAIEESLGRHDKARRAIAALLSVMSDESDGDGMRPVTLSDAFDGLDFLALRVNGEHGATIDHLAIHDDGAGAASAAIADALGAGEIEAGVQSGRRRWTGTPRGALVPGVGDLV